MNELTETNNNINQFQQELMKMMHTAGTLDVTEEQKVILYEEPLDTDILIRPDGLVYLAAEWYRDRLINAFGLKWAMVPQGEPKLESNLVMWGFHLIVNGIYLQYAIGEQLYTDSNRTMSWGDACEGARSNALMRLCKSLGMARKLWKKEFVEEWRTKFCCQVYDKKLDKYIWVKKEHTRMTRSEKGDNSRFLTMMAKCKKELGEEEYYRILVEFGYSHSDEISARPEQEKVYLHMRKIIKEKNHA